MNKIINQDCIIGLKTLPDDSIDCCVTSPPYFGLRDYGTDEQIGMEETPEAFVAKLVEVFTEVKRVLKPEGTLWLNLGDSYASGGKSRTEDQATAKSTLTGGLRSQSQILSQRSKISGTLKAKDLIGIPWMVAFALRSSGWYLRQDIIWNKPNPMPESVTDRCTKAHEYIFLLSKSPKYYYDQDAIKTAVTDATVQRMMQQVEDQKGSARVPGKTNGTMKAVGPGRKPRPGVDEKGGNQGSGSGIKAYTHRGEGDQKLTGHSGNFDKAGNLIGDGMANKKSVWKDDDPYPIWEWLFQNAPIQLIEPLWDQYIEEKANKSSVWTVTTKPFSEAHFATFPETLIVDCIKAGCPEGGIVLDPFMGAGTTALVSSKLGRNYLGFELNRDYIGIATKRLQDQLGFFYKGA